MRGSGAVCMGGGGPGLFPPRLLPAPGVERAEGEEGPGIPGVKPRGVGGGRMEPPDASFAPPHIGVVVGWGGVLPFCPPSRSVRRWKVVAPLSAVPPSISSLLFKLILNNYLFVCLLVCLGQWWQHLVFSPSLLLTA